ncbi:FG-GAP-like repeat-containing protein [Streptomyces sp. NPDC059698]|uniref:FG-GAP-like repeat-containing protein n=1 Tax=unclassified Streptomyces TaxID=2593676 RepID=UPI0009A120AB|nr:FG-GAP-like repeat-containing protein [Streptomyces sp. CB02366]
MKRRVGVIGAAVVCALLGVQAGTGSASAVAGGRGVPGSAAVAATDDPAGFPYVGSAGAEAGSGTRPAGRAPGGTRTTARPAGGTPTATVRTAGKGARHDYDGDGRSDMVAWYDYSEGHDGMRAFLAGPDGGFAAPNRAWESPKGNFWAEHMKRVTGDFNGDGTGDVAAFYGYDDGRVSLLTWLGTGDGAFAPHFASWAVAPDNWTFDAITAEAGDFNGDGRDDIAAWYDYRNGDDKLFTFLADAKGGFGAPFPSFARAAADGWEVDRMKFATGDFDGDGRDDIGVLDSYAAGTVRLMTFASKADGGFGEPVRGWESTGWHFGRVSVHAGDFNGDGRDEFAAWYDYADGHDALIGFDLDAEGRFGNRRELLNAVPGWYERSRMRLVTGDYNGDGRDDLAAFYGYSDTRAKAFTFVATPDGALGDALHSWSEPSGWNLDRTHLFERYSSPPPLPVCPVVYGHGGYPTGDNAYERDQVRQPNHPKGLAQYKSWGAGGVEADLQLTRNGTKGVMWHNRSTWGLTGPKADVTDIWWATGADQLKGRTIIRGPYEGETVYTFREWLESARSQNMAAFVELKGEAGQSLLNPDASIRETAWNEVVAPIAERATKQKIMIYTGAENSALKAELTKRMEAAGLGAALKNHPRWVDSAEYGWEEPAPSASLHHPTWQEKLDQFATPVSAQAMVTTWPRELKSWLSGKCL